MDPATATIMIAAIKAGVIIVKFLAVRKSQSAASNFIARHVEPVAKLIA